jgi:hypothetical protein
MLKPEMLEAIFVAGGVLAGMAGPSWIKAPFTVDTDRLIKVELVRRMMDPRSGNERIGSLEAVPAVCLWRAIAQPEH